MSHRKPIWILPPLATQPANPRDILITTVLTLIVGAVALVVIAYLYSVGVNSVLLIIEGGGIFTLLGIGFAGRLEYLKAKAGKPKP